MIYKDCSFFKCFQGCCLNKKLHNCQHVNNHKNVILLPGWCGLGSIQRKILSSFWECWLGMTILCKIWKCDIFTCEHCTSNDVFP